MSTIYIHSRHEILPLLSFEVRMVRVAVESLVRQISATLIMTVSVLGVTGKLPVVQGRAVMIMSVNVLSVAGENLTVRSRVGLNTSDLVLGAAGEYPIVRSEAVMITSVNVLVVEGVNLTVRSRSEKSTFQTQSLKSYSYFFLCLQKQKIKNQSI